MDKQHNTKNIVGFAKLEKELSLFEREYFGIPYWQLIRFDVCESIFSNRMEIQNTIKDKLWKNPIYLFKRILVLSIISLKELFSKDLWKDAEIIELRTTDLQDRFFSGWMIPESIIYTAIRNCELGTDLDFTRHFTAKPYINTQFLNFLMKITKVRKNDSKEKEFLRILEKRFVAQFGKCMTSEEMEKQIHKEITKQKCYSKYFKKLIDRTNCKAIIVIQYYQPQLFSLYKMAKERNIKIIELQHGVINNHEEYWFEDRRGINNFTPDFLLTFGELHNSWIQLVKGSQAIAIGCPYQREQIEKFDKLTTNERVVVVYPESNPLFENTIDVFINLIVNRGYEVIIKLHPQEAEQLESYYPLLSKNRNARIVTSQKEGIYYWLKMAKHHVMAGTTVGLEAMLFDDINVCIAENVPHEQTQPLLDCDAARGFHTAEELVNLIIDPVVNNEAIRGIRELLWKNNAATNMENFIKNLKKNDWEFLP